MRNRAKMFGMVLCALAAAACSGNGNGTGGGGGTGGAGGTGGSGGTAGTGGTGGGAQTSTVNGTVRTFLSLQDPVVVPGATVRVLDTDLSATADQNGAFTIEDVPNGENFFAVEAQGHWGSVDYWDVPTETDQGFVLYAVTDADVLSIDDELDDRTISADDGMVEMFFSPAATGAAGTINPANHDAPFTLDADGFLVVQDTVINAGGEGDLFFTSVPAGGTVTADVTGPPGTTCEIIESDPGTYPIFAKSITVIYAACQ